MTNKAVAEKKTLNKPKQTKDSLPFLLSVVLYSLIVVSSICILALSTAVISHLPQFKALYSFFNSATFTLQLEWYVYTPILFFVLSLYSCVQLIRKQKHALYLFALLSIGLSVFIMSTEPIDYTNLILTLLISLVVLIHTPWLLKHSKAKQQDF